MPWPARNRIRHMVSELRIYHRGEALREVTISIGVAMYPNNGDSLEQLLGPCRPRLFTRQSIWAATAWFWLSSSASAHLPQTNHPSSSRFLTNRTGSPLSLGSLRLRRHRLGVVPAAGSDEELSVALRRAPPLSRRDIRPARAVWSSDSRWCTGCGYRGQLRRRS